MKTVYHQTLRVHLYRIHHDLWHQSGRTFDGRSRKFHLPLLDCLIKQRALRGLEGIYRESMDWRSAMLRNFGVGTQDVGAEVHLIGYLREAMG